MTTTTPTTTSATLGHLALHYRPGDGERSRMLFECLGARLEDNGPPGFCSIVFDPAGWNYVDNVMYLSQAGTVKLALEEAITEGLHVGEADEDPRAPPSATCASPAPNRSTTSGSGTRRSTSSNARSARSRTPPRPAACSRAALRPRGTAPAPDRTRRSTS